MSISVNPVLPVIVAQGASPDLVLQPGTAIDALVLKVLSDNLVRIAISGVSLDVLSEIPLQAGQALQLAVSQTQDGIKLTVAGPASGAAAGASSDTVTLAPNAIADAAASPALGAAQPKNIMTPLERLALSAAVQTAAARQGSQAPLFANLQVAAASGGLPPALQQAAIQVLAQRSSLDQNLTGSDVKIAFQKSGLFLEASLASGSASPVAGIPDLKAALIVLRQTLLSSLGTAGAAENPAASATAAQPVLSATPDGSASDVTSPPHAAATSTLVPSLSPDIDVQEVVLPLARVPVAEEFFELCRHRPIRALGNIAERRTTRGGNRRGVKSAAGDPAGDPAGSWQRIAGDRNAERWMERRHHLSYQYAASAVSRCVAFGAAGRLAVDFFQCTACDNRASSARRCRRRHCASDIAAGGVTAGSRRYRRRTDRSGYPAMEFRNPVCGAAGDSDGAIRNFA